MRSLVPACIAEFFGAFALMFVGGGAMINMAAASHSAIPPSGGTALVVVALAHGLILAVTVSATMHISGGQFNPAVSLALAVIGRQGWVQAALFTAFQLMGGVAAAWVLAGAFDAISVGLVAHGATMGSLTSGGSADALLLVIVEALATFTLMMVIMGTAVDPRGVGKSATVGGFGIGLCVSGLILAVGPLTGASMNPCRSFGPALVGGHWAQHWAYWVGPIAGASAAALLWHLVLAGREAEYPPVDHELGEGRRG